MESRVRSFHIQTAALFGIQGLYSAVLCNVASRQNLAKTVFSGLGFGIPVTSVTQNTKLQSRDDKRWEGRLMAVVLRWNTNFFVDNRFKIDLRFLGG